MEQQPLLFPAADALLTATDVSADPAETAGPEAAASPGLTGARSSASGGAECTSSPTILTVTEFTRQVKQCLEGQFPDVWVVGEVSGFKAASSGHWYFDLKDADSIVRMVMFRGPAQRVRFRVENGMQLICHGKANCYEKRGEYSIIVDTMEPQGVGALQVAFEQLKARLEQEGLFAKARKRPLPWWPRCIGVVTSPTGAALRDILQILKRRAPTIDILIAPAKVQGEGAAAEIAAAIAALDATRRCDVMIVGRGGGSLEDLWAFNEEVVARAIAAATTPIVSAVGHEIDFTIADFVADLRAPTPSAAAELVAPAQAEVLAQLRQYRRGLQVGLRRWWESRAQRLVELTRRLRPPTARCEQYVMQIDHARDRLAAAVQRHAETAAARLQQLTAELEHLSPLTTLRRGYAVALDRATGRVLRRCADLQVGMEVTLRVSDGQAVTRILEVNS